MFESHVSFKMRGTNTAVVAVLAFKWLLPSVNPEMLFQITRTVETSAASAAHIRPFSSVSPEMNFQVDLLIECFLTNCTYKWPFSGMNKNVSLEVT